MSGLNKVEDKIEVEVLNSVVRKLAMWNHVGSRKYKTNNHSSLTVACAALAKPTRPNRNLWWFVEIKNQSWIGSIGSMKFMRLAKHSNLTSLRPCFPQVPTCAKRESMHCFASPDFHPTLLKYCPKCFSTGILDTASWPLSSKQLDWTTAVKARWANIDMPHKSWQI